MNQGKHDEVKTVNGKSKHQNFNKQWTKIDGNEQI